MMKEKWIPSNKKKPEMGQQCIVTFDGDRENNGDPWVTTMIYIPDSLFWEFVTAWMPCPEPYKEGES